MVTSSEIISDIQQYAHPEKGKLLQRFFKTGPGEYGEGDVFWGVTMPEARTVAKKYFKETSLPVIAELLTSPVHEHRMVALLIMDYQFPKAGPEKQQELYEFYLTHTDRINNWDLVDVTCRAIVGAYLWKRERKVLYELAESKLLWDRRIAMVACYEFIRQGDYKDTLVLAGILLNDKEDLMHKAVGWMLREVYKRDTHQVEEKEIIGRACAALINRL